MKFKIKKMKEKLYYGLKYLSKKIKIKKEHMIK